MRQVKLKDITTKIGSGATPSGGKQSYITTGIALIRSLNVFDLNFSYDELAYINDEQAKKLNNVTIEPDDILLNITGASVARCCILPKNLLPARVNQHVSIVRINKDLANPYFIQYLLVSPYYKQKLLSIAQGGATREALTKESIENFEIIIPKSKKTQDKIAKILSNYDDLIEKNNKRIKILEEMAQKIHKEWFVDFKFPGHNDATFKDSTLGKIPSEWKIGIIKDINDVKGGYAYKSNDLKEAGKYRIIKIKNIQLGNIDIEKCQYIDDDIASKTIAFKLNEGDMLIAMTGAQVGKVGIIPQTKQACYLNQRVGKFIPNKPFVFNNQYLSIYTQLEKFNTQINNIASGAAQPNISTSQIENIEILIPNDEIITKFEKTVDPLFKETQTLKNKNQTLKQTRDILLPRLISGEIDVENMEIL